MVVLALVIFDFAGAADRDKTARSVILGLLGTPSTLWLQVGWFLIAFLGLHAALPLVVSRGSQALVRRLVRSESEERQAHALLILVAILFVMLLNARWYPESVFADGLTGFGSGALGAGLILLLGTVVVVPMIYGLGALVLSWPGRPEVRPLVTGVILVLVVSVSTVLALGALRSDPPTRVSEQPHVILVGIDGWRLDAAPLTGGRPEIMPFVDSIFRRSAVVRESYTPLGRTYPAWMTLLTGRDPAAHGARFNLIADEALTGAGTLQDLLGDRGYHSILAMDERRFANITREHGFDRIVGPPAGASDFLLGHLNDTPLSNLVGNTRPGAFLFPNTHGNRAAAATYDPRIFDRALKRSVRSAPDGPLFLAVHYALPHWPYHWAGSGEAVSGGAVSDGAVSDDPSASAPDEYFQTLARADQQVSVLFEFLRERGILDHAIVVVFSDHGEVFPARTERWSEARGGDVLSERHGHGTHVLNLDQVRVPLAFLHLAGRELESGLRPIRASIADILPTLGEWLELPLPDDLDGMSLAAELIAPTGATWERVLAFETGFNLDALGDEAVSTERLLDEGAASYRILPDGDLVLKDERVEELTRTKERAILRGDWMLASFPGGQRTGRESLLLAHVPTRTLAWAGELDIGERSWFPDVPDSPDPPPPPIAEMREAFCDRFAPDQRLAPSRLCRGSPQYR